MIDKGV